MSRRDILLRAGVGGGVIVAASVLASSPALAQTPNPTEPFASRTGRTPSSNPELTNKAYVDAQTGLLVKRAGDTMTGSLTLAWNGATAPLRLPDTGTGTDAPNSVADGDIWHRSSTLYARLGGSTHTLIHSGNPTDLATDINQNDAEAGTATVRQWFTAERVRQASLAGAAAWWDASDPKAKLDGIEDGAQVNVGTDLSITGTGDSRTITSSTGEDVTVPVATASNAGLMATGDKAKLDGIEDGAQVNVGTDLSITGGTTTGPTITSSTGTGAGASVTLPAADDDASGVVTTGNQTFAGAKTFTNTITGDISGNAGTATVLANTQTLWGQNFNGAAPVSGDLTGVGNITGTGAVALTATAGTLGLAATGNNSITASTNNVERLRISGTGEIELLGTVRFDGRTEFGGEVVFEEGGGLGSFTALDGGGPERGVRFSASADAGYVTAPA